MNSKLNTFGDEVIDSSFKQNLNTFTILTSNQKKEFTKNLPVLVEHLARDVPVGIINVICIAVGLVVTPVLYQCIAVAV